MKAVDELGMIQAQIAELREEERKLKAWVLEQDQLGLELEGELFKATVVEQERKSVNWKKIATDLGASIQKIRANTKVTDVIAVKVTARNTAARRAA